MWDDPRQLNALSLVLASAAFVALAWAGVAWLVRQTWFDFREVAVVTPLAHASAPHLEAAIRGDLKGTFFTLDLRQAQDALRNVPWVRSVALRRQWPRRLTVEIEEQVPFARWNDSALVNTHGEVFLADWNGDLPRFDGPEGRSDVMTQRYQSWSATLATLGLTIRALRLSARGGWEIDAEGPHGPLTVEVGRDEADARLARFVAAYARTVEAVERAGTRVDQVDLRYRNGFAARAPDLHETTARKPS